MTPIPSLTRHPCHDSNSSIPPHTRAAAEAALAHEGFRGIKLRPLEAATPASKEKAELCISKAGEATAAAALAG